MKNDKDCLILIPGESDLEPAWYKLAVGEDIWIEDEFAGDGFRKVGKRIHTGDAERCLELCVLNPMSIKLSGDNSIKDAEDLSSALKIIKEYIDKSNPKILSEGRNILCGHFSAPIGNMRKLCCKTWEDDEDLKWSIDSLMGRGDNLITSYTLGGMYPDEATRIIGNLKSLIEGGQATLESIHPLARELFDYLWRKTKVTKLTELARSFFMLWLSGGRCGDQQILKGTLQEILEDKDSYTLEAPDLKPIKEFVDARKNLLDFSKEEKQGVFDLLDRIIMDSM